MGIIINLVMKLSFKGKCQLFALKEIVQLKMKLQTYKAIPRNSDFTLPNTHISSSLTFNK